MSILTAILNFFLGVSELAETAQLHAPRYLSTETAKDHALAASLASTRKVSPELLLAMAYNESRYLPEATSRMEKGRRVTGIPTWASPPKGVKGPYFCGITQAQAGMSWKRCLALRDINVAYQTTAKELAQWLAYCKGDMVCALTGYGGGFAAVRAGVSTYPRRVLSRATMLKGANS